MQKLLAKLFNFIAIHSDIYKETVDMFNRRLIERTQGMLSAIVKAEENERMMYRHYLAAMREADQWRIRATKPRNPF